jgi:hypothetical protein
MSKNLSPPESGVPGPTTGHVRIQAQDRHWTSGRIFAKMKAR